MNFRKGLVPGKEVREHHNRPKKGSHSTVSRQERREVTAFKKHSRKRGRYAEQFEADDLIKEFFDEYESDDQA